MARDGMLRSGVPSRPTSRSRPTIPSPEFLRPKRGPAFQMGLDYKTAEMSADVPLWLYLTVWGSNIDFPTTASGVEIDVSGGLKFLGFDKKLSVDFGYMPTATVLTRPSHRLLGSRLSLCALLSVGRRSQGGTTNEGHASVALPCRLGGLR
jgi:hypothetical protein